MSEHRPKRRLAPIFLAGTFVTLIAGYGLGYFLLPYSKTVGTMGFRSFGSKWQCALYAPAARFEAWSRGILILVDYQSDGPNPKAVHYQTYQYPPMDP